jgi:hypothetical protein
VWPDTSITGTCNSTRELYCGSYNDRLRIVRAVEYSDDYFRHVRPSVRLSADVRAVHAGWISVKFDMEDVHEGMSTKFK